MNRKWLMTTLATGVVGILALGNGCYSYTPAPEGQTGTTFTERKLAESDKILSDIKVLTLKQAQEIAVMNNPTCRKCCQNELLPGSGCIFTDRFSQFYYVQT